MLARVKEFVGDDDKLLAEYQQYTDADIDIDIDIESGQPGDFDQELKDCVEEPRRVLRRVLRRESPRESLRARLRVQVCLQRVFKCVFTQSENAVS